MEEKHTIIADQCLVSTRHKRSVNQDRGFIQVGDGFFLGICCDGVSDSDGALAAELAVETAKKYVPALLQSLQGLEQEAGDTIRSWFCTVFSAAQERVEMAGNCATTISCAVVFDGYVYTANLGDSPMWLFLRENQWEPPVSLFTCHNAKGELMAKGLDSQGASSNQLKRWIGDRFRFDEQLISFHSMPLFRENILLIGSDGALDMTMNDVFVDLVTTCYSMEELCGAAYEYQDTAGSTDNFTLIAIRIHRQ